MYKQTRERKQTQFFRDIEWMPGANNQHTQGRETDNWQQGELQGDEYDGEGFETRADAAFIVNDSEKAIQKAAEDRMMIDGLDILDAAAEAQSESESDDEEDSEDCWSAMSEDESEDDDESDDDESDDNDDDDDSEPNHGQPTPYEVSEQSLARDRSEGWWL